MYKSGLSDSKRAAIQDCAERMRAHMGDAVDTWVDSAEKMVAVWQDLGEAIADAMARLVEIWEEYKDVVDWSFLYSEPAHLVGSRVLSQAQYYRFQCVRVRCTYHVARFSWSSKWHASTMPRVRWRGP